MPSGPFAPISKKQNFGTRRIDGGSPDAWRNSVNYKALRAQRVRRLTSIKFDLKSDDAMWDPNIGPNGGWRCGGELTEGGQFTDRYGRGCGGAVRRLMNAIGGTISRVMPGRIGKNPARIAESVTREMDVAVERDRNQNANWWEAFSSQKPNWLKVQERVMESIRSDKTLSATKIQSAIRKIENDLSVVRGIIKSGKLTPSEENMQKIRADIYQDDLAFLESLLENAFEGELRTSRPIGVALSRIPKGPAQEDARQQIKAATDAWRVRIEDVMRNGTYKQLLDLLDELTKVSADQFQIQMDSDKPDVERAIATSMVQFFNRRLPEIQEAANVRQRSIKKRGSILQAIKEAARAKVRRQTIDPLVESWLADQIVARDYLRNPVSSKAKERGRLAAIPDETIIEAMIGDDTIVDEVGSDVGGGVPLPSIRPDDPVSVNDILRSEAGGFPVGTKLSNSRFEFEMIKNNAFRQLWTVWKVTDKDTGETYFLKGSNMSPNEAIAEIAGSVIAGMLGYNTDDRFGGIRVDKRRTPGGDTRAARWVISRHVGHYQEDSGTGEKLDTYKSAARVVSERGENITFVQLRPDDKAQRVDVLDLEPEETAKITLLDYLLDNHDRHFGNFFIYPDEDGVDRIAPIDHGIVSGGEVDRGLSTVVSADQLAEDAAYRASLTPQEFTENVMHPVFNYVHVSSSKRNQYRQALDQLLETLDEATIDEMLSPESLSRRGMTMSATERAHLAAIREVAKARLAILKSRGTGTMIAPFRDRIETNVSAADIASRAVTREIR